MNFNAHVATKAQAAQRLAASSLPQHVKDLLGAQLAALEEPGDARSLVVRCSGTAFGGSGSSWFAEVRHSAAALA